MSDISFPVVHTIAIVGISASPERPSYQVASYLRKKNYQIIPINPAFSSWEGLTAYPDLKHVPAEIKIDVVNIFRRAENILIHVKEAAEREGVSIIWLPEGIDVPEAKNIAEQYGKQLIMNACLMKQHEAGNAS